MHKIQLLVSALIILLLVSFSPSKKGYKQVANSKVVLAKLKFVADKTNTITADFKEETFLAAFSEPQLSTGKFYYQSENKMRWTQNSPFEYIILINGESLRIKNNGEEQKNVGSKNMAKKINTFMLNMIKGDYHDDSNMKTTVYESASNYLLEMVPTTKPMNKIYAKFEMYFSKATKRLESIILFQPGGDKKIITFSNQKYNTKIEDSIFTTL